MDVYETVKTIGSGSFGQVYMARHKREGKHYVVKRVKTRDMSQKDLENTENEVSSMRLFVDCQLLLLDYISANLSSQTFVLTLLCIHHIGTPPPKNTAFEYCGVQGQLRR